MTRDIYVNTVIVYQNDVDTLFETLVLKTER